MCKSFFVSEKLDVTYSRSTGPGGQNVNMVNTKVDLRFNVEKADWLSQEIRQKLMEQVSFVICLMYTYYTSSRHDSKCAYQDR